MTYRAAFGFFGGHLAPQRGALLRALGWSTIEALPTFAGGLLVATALDRGFLAGRALEGVAWLAALAGLSAIGAIATWRMYPWLGRAVESTRDGLLRDVVRGALAGTVSGQASSGAGVAHATEQVETVRNLLTALLRSVRQLVTPLVAACAGLAVLSPVLAAVAAVPALVALAIYACAARGLLARERAVVEAGEALASTAAVAFDGVRDIVACAAQERACAAIAVPIEREAAAARALARSNTLRQLVDALGSGVPTIAILAAAPWLLAHGHVSVGDIAGAVTYVATGMRPALDAIVAQGGAWVMQLAVTLSRLADVGTRCVDDRGGRRAVPADAALKLDGVTFAYAAGATPVVERLTATIAAGVQIAVVGPSGAGKSTLAGLVAGVLEPSAGRIELGGIAVADAEPAAIALVPQEAYVFAGAVRENVAYLRPAASDAAIREAVAAVGADALVARLGGLDAELEPGGGGLSAGERQLIALARTYLSPARVVVLDEATCHLDPAAESRAEQAFRRRPGTLIVIAHRISSALRADRVLVLDGTGASLGTHADLLAAGGLYADLVGHWSAGRAVAA